MAEAALANGLDRSFDHGLKLHGQANGVAHTRDEVARLYGLDLQLQLPFQRVEATPDVLHGNATTQGDLLQGPGDALDAARSVHRRCGCHRRVLAAEDMLANRVVVDFLGTHEHPLGQAEFLGQGRDLIRCLLQCQLRL